MILQQAAAHITSLALIKLFPSVTILDSGSLGHGFYIDVVGLPFCDAQVLKLIEEKSISFLDEELSCSYKEMIRQNAVDFLRHHQQVVLAEIVCDLEDSLITLLDLEGVTLISRLPLGTSFSDVRALKLFEIEELDSHDSLGSILRIHGTSAVSRFELKEKIKFRQKEDLCSYRKQWIREKSVTSNDKEEFSWSLELSFIRHQVKSLWSRFCELSFGRFFDWEMPPVLFQDVPRLWEKKIDLLSGCYHEKLISWLRYEDVAQKNLLSVFESDSILVPLLEESSLQSLISWVESWSRMWSFPYSFVIRSKGVSSYGASRFWRVGVHKLKLACESVGCAYVVEEDSLGAHQPYLACVWKDHLGRSWDISHLRFVSDKCQYAVVSLLGCFETFLGFLFEVYSQQGWPLFLTQQHVAIISESVVTQAYARDLASQWHSLGLKVDVCAPSPSVLSKIKESAAAKIPYLVVLDQQDLLKQTLSLRKSHGKEIKGIKSGDFIKIAFEELSQFQPFKQLFQLSKEV